MKLLTALGILATAGAAVALNDTPVIQSSYLVHANPPAAGATTGTITGKILFDGEEIPKPGKLDNITEKAAEGCVAGGLPNDEDPTLLVDKDGGIKNAVIEVEVKGAELALSEKPIVLDQMQCRYEPHITLVAVGSTVEYLNSDKVSHNVHTFPTKNEGFNKTIPAGSKDAQKLDKTEAIQVKCDIHPWMSAYIYVTDTPYATATAADGSFSIPNVAPGTYKVNVWHEKLGKAKGEVTIAEDGTCTALEIKLGEKKGGGRRR